MAVWLSGAQAGLCLGEVMAEGEGGSSVAAGPVAVESPAKLRTLGQN